jgi:outer membrane protein assembly factor BamB
MSDLHALIDDIRRQVHSSPGTLDRIHKRYRHRELRRRVTAAGLALVVATAGILLMTRALRFGDRSVPAAPTIDSLNVSRLATVWSREIAGIGATAPVRDQGVLYVSSTEGQLLAIDARTGETRWVGITPTGPATSPVVAGGSVFVEAGGSLVAFDVGCGEGGATCAPRWTASTGGANLATPSVADGVVYVTAFPGGTFAYPLTCSDPCEPLWRAPDPGGHVARTPAIAGGIVWDSSTHALVAYPTSCERACTPIARDLSPDGTDLSSPPAVDDGVVYVGTSDGRLLAIPQSCVAGGPCGPLWEASTGGGVTAIPVIADGMVLVGSSDGRVNAFPTACGTEGGTCRPRWVAHIEAPITQPPVVAGGLVLVVSTDGTLSILPEDCSRTCRPLSALTLGDLPAAPLSWADRTIYATSADGTLTAYTVDGVPV